ncbi:hypothetical protein GCQ56_07015 [Marinifilum sp. N1E240]|uniref:alpha/beta hydrolase n=1 Tax=Marinifilum sp. N1E240 TaxID=2608082 RepID=UPI00128D0D28|nr:alpha/beta hydrolase-fold protein [Marinifilum sp. N1E240]MPQ46760.1 hypothetical protein [Marinifilum sp. N1E240]
MKVRFDDIDQITDFNNCAGKISISIFKSEKRSWVPYFVYLPPEWDTSSNYPLILFMHGQGGDETTFKKYVRVEQLNKWISDGEIEPIVIVGVRGDNDRDSVQWFTEENESLIVGDLVGELVNYCRDKFKAGIGDRNVSIEGHSRGAAGAIHYYLKYPGKFASVVGMGYVSDYTLNNNCILAKNNIDTLQNKSVPFRLEIGTEDSFVSTKNRRCIYDLHDCLNALDLEHEFEVLHGVEHGFDTFWNYFTDEGIVNGLSHLKFHEKARKNSK